MQELLSNEKVHLSDQIVIYWSDEDSAWVAHSLRTDQVAVADGIIEALARLISGVHGLLELAAQDTSINYLREAPDEIQRLAASAQPLPAELVEVAHKVSTGQWPSSLPVRVDSRQPLLAQLEEGSEQLVTHP